MSDVANVIPRQLANSSHIGDSRIPLMQGHGGSELVMLYLAIVIPVTTINSD